MGIPDQEAPPPPPPQSMPPSAYGYPVHHGDPTLPRYEATYAHPPPPPPGMYTMTAQPTQIIIPATFNDNPALVMCPTCHQQVLTRISYTSGALTWIIVGSLCLFGLWFGCQCIPFCVDACKDVEHSCPNCNTLIGIHKRL